MVKNRLPELLKNSGLNGNNNCINDISNGSDDVIVTIENTEIKKLLKNYEDIILSIDVIRTNLEKMIEMTQIINLRNVNEDELDRLRNENLKTGQILMKKFSTLKTQLPEKDDFTLEARMNRCLYYGLHQTYINLWTKNETFLAAYETKLKKNIQMHAQILNCNPNDEEVEELIANKQKSLFVGNILEETENERRTLRGLMERHAELIRLEKSIEDVHTLFLRIQALVIEQSEKIQIVEYHASQATVRVGAGNDELMGARKLKNKTMKLKFILIAIIVSLLALFLISAFK